MRPALRLLSLLPVLAAAWAPGAAADRLVRRDGTVVEGVVTKDGDVYRIVSRFGEAEVPVADVTAWEKGAPSLETQWRERAAALRPDDHAGRAQLARWLEERGLPEEARGVAEQVVREDPENALAHEVLGHVRHRGAWMTPEEAKRAEGLVERGGRWYTPQEWALLDGAAKAAAEEADRRLASERASARVSEAVRMMLAPDDGLRTEGERRLAALAAETQNPAFRDLLPQVKAFAAASDRLRSALQGPTTVESADVLMECRIQMAKLKRPIQTFETSLASNVSSAPVKLQLPELEVISVGSTVKVPVR